MEHLKKLLMSAVTVKTTETELPKSSEAHIILPHDSYHMTGAIRLLFSQMILLVLCSLILSIYAFSIDQERYSQFSQIFLFSYH